MLAPSLDPITLSFHPPALLYAPTPHFAPSLAFSSFPPFISHHSWSDLLVWPSLALVFTERRLFLHLFPFTPSSPGPSGQPLWPSSPSHTIRNRLQPGLLPRQVCHSCHLNPAALVFVSPFFGPPPSTKVSRSQPSSPARQLSSVRTGLHLVAPQPPFKLSLLAHRHGSPSTAELSSKKQFLRVLCSRSASTQISQVEQAPTFSPGFH